MRILFVLISLFITFSSNSQHDEILRQLESYISFRSEHGRYSGVTAIYNSNGNIFFNQAGLSNRTFNSPVKKDTKFDLASVTKLFTTAAIAILYENGKINLDEPFMSYFPDFPLKTANSITVRQLLSHTSGFSDFFFEDTYLKYDRNRLRELKDYDIFYKTIRIGQIPENNMLYSNTNYIILGRIIEKISGTDYYLFLQTEIFDKLGMVNTGFYEKDAIVENMATGYYIDPQASMEFNVPNDAVLRSNVSLRAIKGMSAGGAWSTADDMYSFLKSIFKGELIKSETLDEFTQQQSSGYALGFQVFEQENIQAIGHSGGFYGVSSMSFFLPDADLFFICLTNSDFAAQPVFDRFLSLLSGNKPFTPISISKDQFQKVEGYYEVVSGEMKGKQLFVEAKSDRLLFDKELEFFPYDNLSFFDIDNDLFFLTFQVDDNDKVTGFSRGDNRMFHQKAKKIDSSKVVKMAPVKLLPSELKSYEIQLKFAEDGMMAGHIPDIIADNTGLIIDNMMRFLPYAKDKFFLHDDVGMQLQFFRNDEGEIIKAEVLREGEVQGTLFPY